MFYRNARIFTPDFRFQTGAFEVTEGVFGQVLPESVPQDAIDLKGATVIPGLVDVHSHGNSGADFSDGDYEGLKKMAAQYAAWGVTSFAPASMTLPYDILEQAFATAARLVKESPRDHARLMGIQMEGPYFSYKKRGAQNAEYLKDPDFEGFRKLYEDCGGLVRIVDVAPELPGAAAFVAQAKGIPAKQIPDEVARVVAETRLDEMAGRLIRNLSKGYRQRVGIAQALLGSPPYIILDEPTVGLDPLQIIEIRDLIRQLGEKHTVILSSHILSEVQAICESVLIIAHGKLVAFDTPQNLEKMLTAAGRMTLCAEATPDQVQGLLAGVSQVTGCQAQADEAAGGCRAELTLQGDANAAARAVFLAFAKAGRPILQMTPVRADLENIFIELTEDEPSGKKEPIHESGI